jgi:hypothetical protein
MNEAPIPLLAYIFVGITSAVLAAVTAMDKQGPTSSGPATNMLPGQTGGLSEINRKEKKHKNPSKTRKNKR